MVSEPWGEGDPPPTSEELVAVWDTGATSSVISQQVVDACGLKPISRAKVRGVSGDFETSVFLVGIYLPNGVAFGEVPVTLGECGDADVLIGMDIISVGDFAVTNLGGRTTFTFRIPSQSDIDFSEQAQRSFRRRRRRQYLRAAAAGVLLGLALGIVAAVIWESLAG